MIPLKAGLPPPPPRIARLPRDPRGYPIPWFLNRETKDGKPIGDDEIDFRYINGRKVAQAVQFSLCWVCGEPRGRNFSFPIGSMCVVNRVSAEPPCHHECAVYAAMACPFLSNPKMRRNEKDEPDGLLDSPAMIERNPGVAAVWPTRSFKMFPGPRREPLFEIGPLEGLITWYREGRPATRDEILESITSGLPILRAMCDRAEAGKAAAQHAELDEAVKRAMVFLP